MNPCLSSALNYAQSNYKVFPLKCNTKSGQVVSSWKKDASTDLEKIYNWFNHSDYNYGIVTGSGLIVIDVDNKNGKLGSNYIKSYIKDFPDTKVVMTPNKGFHIYFCVDRPIKSSVNLYPGIDIRGEGGYIVGPGSSIDGKVYEELVRDKPIALANDSVYEFLESPRIQKEHCLDSNQCIPEGVRNDTLFRYGCSLQSRGMSDELIQKSLEIENEKRCIPPLEIQEVHQIANNIIHRYPKENEKIDSEITWESAIKMSQMEISKSTDIIEGLLPVGVTLLSAPAKMGKTFFCMQMANSVASGSNFLGYHTKKRNAYYIVLEDPRNIQIQRLQCAKNAISSGYDIEFCQAYDQRFNLEEKIKKYIKYNPSLGLVVVDTFEKIREDNDRTYGIDYKEVTYYHDLAMKYGIAIVLVMHTIKNVNYSNIFANITGSGGTLAAADGLMVILKSQTSEQVKQLYIDGKAIPSDVVLLKQDQNMMYHKVEIEKEVIIDPELNDLIKYVIEVGKYHGPCEKLGVKARLLNCNGRHVRSLLDNNQDILKSYFIQYRVPNRSSYSRKIELIYYGEDSDDYDANDAMTISGAQE